MGDVVLSWEQDGLEETQTGLVDVALANSLAAHTCAAFCVNPPIVAGGPLFSHISIYIPFFHFISMLIWEGQKQNKKPHVMSFIVMQLVSLSAQSGGADPRGPRPPLPSHQNSLCGIKGGTYRWRACLTYRR